VRQRGTGCAVSKHARCYESRLNVPIILPQSRAQAANAIIPALLTVHVVRCACTRLLSSVCVRALVRVNE
jgi:hypothetical protein